MSTVSDAGRYDRMERISWVDMSAIHGAKVLVAGIGALGNEVLKDLALAGFRDVTAVDPDVVERSNLSRCVLFRERHVGRHKADAAAESIRELDPGCRIRAAVCRVQEVDTSSFEVLIGCLDNVVSRLSLNSYAKYHHIPYVDGATDGFRGKVQVILPVGPCLECSMNRTHLAELHRTFSCDPKGAEQRDPVILASGITTTSVIAGMCVREVIKIVCRMESLCIRGISYYDGIQGTSEILGLSIKPGCPNHEGEQ